MKLTTQERLFLYNNLDQDTLLHFLNKKGAFFDIARINNDKNINSIRKEKILVTIGELCDKGYAYGDDKTKKVTITRKGKWRLLYTNPTLTFWAIVIGIIEIVLPIWLSNNTNTIPPKNKSVSLPSKTDDSLLQNEKRRKDSADKKTIKLHSP